MKFLKIIFICASFININSQTKFADEIISTKAHNEYGLTFINANWICFTRSGERNTLMLSKYKNDCWTAPYVAPFSGNYSDEYPRFDKTSNRLFFSSKRPSGDNMVKASNDIWFVEFKNNSWSEPIHLDGNFSTNGIDSGAENALGKIYFHSDRAGKGLNDVDIYALPFDNPDGVVELVSVSSNRVDGEPYIFNNGKAMLFMSAGHDSVGKSDIFLSFFKNGEWTKPESIDSEGLVNTTAWEYSPVLSPDLKTLYFTRLGIGKANIYAVDVKMLSNKQLKKIVGL